MDGRLQIPSGNSNRDGQWDFASIMGQFCVLISGIKKWNCLPGDRPGDPLFFIDTKWMDNWLQLYLVMRGCQIMEYKRVLHAVISY